MRASGQSSHWQPICSGSNQGDTSFANQLPNYRAVFGVIERMGWIRSTRGPGRTVLGNTQ